MERNISILFDKNTIAIDINKRVYVIIACVVMLLSHLFSPIESTIAITLFLGGLFLSVETSVCIYICSIIIQIEYTDLHSRLLPIMLVIICLYAFFKYGLFKRLNRVFIPCLLLWFCSLLSIVLGYKTTMLSSLFVLMQLLMILTVTYFSKKTISLFIIGFVVSGLCICLYTFYLYITGAATLFGVSLAYGDGEEAGQIKSLAIAVAVPAFYYVYNLFYGKTGWIKKTFYVFIILLCILVVVLTYSRGVLIALAASAALLILSFFKDKKIMFKIIIACVVFVLLYNTLMQIDINEDKMFGSIEGANGRTDIWAYFFAKMQNDGLLRLLFGFGPGDSKRITDGSSFAGYYSHSAILDFFFSYGFFGLLFISYILWYTFKNLWKNKDVFCLGLFVLTVLMFSTHGTSNNVIFYGLLSICIGASLENHDNTMMNKILRTMLTYLKSNRFDY
jgi:hypothetical protein